MALEIFYIKGAIEIHNTNNPREYFSNSVKSLKYILYFCMEIILIVLTFLALYYFSYLIKNEFFMVLFSLIFYFSIVSIIIFLGAIFYIHLEFMNWILRILSIQFNTQLLEVFVVLFIIIEFIVLPVFLEFMKNRRYYVEITSDMVIIHMYYVFKKKIPISSGASIIFKKVFKTIQFKNKKQITSY